LETGFPGSAFAEDQEFGFVEMIDAAGFALAEIIKDGFVALTRDFGWWGYEGAAFDVDAGAFPPTGSPFNGKTASDLREKRSQVRGRGGGDIEYLERSQICQWSQVRHPRAGDSERPQGYQTRQRSQIRDTCAVDTKRLQQCQTR